MQKSPGRCVQKVEATMKLVLAKLEHGADTSVPLPDEVKAGTYGGGGLTGAGIELMGVEVDRVYSSCGDWGCDSGTVSKSLENQTFGDDDTVVRRRRLHRR
ncbi:hypothetical protein Bca4012_037146 [Brassica carinata]